jgi:diguanylate cyclase (GGDEF)-like protein
VPAAPTTPEDARAVQALEASFRAETRTATRGSGLVLTAIGLVAVPAWGIVDVLFEPANVPLFFALRAAACALLVTFGLVLWRTPFGRRHAATVVLCLIGCVQIAIAVMIARLHSAYTIYANGLSLPVYASGFLVIWSWRSTLATAAVTWLALAAAYATSPVAQPAGTASAVALYLATASLMAVGGSWYRHRLAWREFAARTALVVEQRRNAGLMAQLERLTREDDLTGLANRRAWDEALDRELARSRRTGAPFAVLLCDLDRFKAVNDGYGHPAGDHVLRETAAAFLARARATDLVARLGGDELGVLCPDTGPEDAVRLAVDLHALAPEVRLPDGSRAPITFSLGLANSVGGEDRDGLLGRADAQLYLAKAGRDAVWSEGRPVRGEPAAPRSTG